jgi:hypothetical protein
MAYAKSRQASVGKTVEPLLMQISPLAEKPAMMLCSPCDIFAA